MTNKYHRYIIEENVCDECKENYFETIVKQWETAHPECRDKKGSIKREYFDEWNEVYHNCPKKLCFVFIADCGGDGICLCEEHLLEVLKLLKEKTCG